ncbi:hypothetical protein Halar_3602 [halophilic archaeon DL31]|nr:hypothetical protein Halar_3602 [halophilic archaeon DL31]
MTTRYEIWQEWTDRYIDTENPIPLFDTDENLNAEFKHYGRTIGES